MRNPRDTLGFLLSLSRFHTLGVTKGLQAKYWGIRPNSLDIRTSREGFVTNEALPTYAATALSLWISLHLSHELLNVPFVIFDTRVRDSVGPPQSPSMQQLRQKAPRSLLRHGAKKSLGEQLLRSPDCLISCLFALFAFNDTFPGLTLPWSPSNATAGRIFYLRRTPPLRAAPQVAIDSPEPKRCALSQNGYGLKC